MSIVEKYKNLGIEVETNFAGDEICKVHLFFTPEQWVDIANPDGDILPYCCSAISGIRDELIDCLCNGGWIYTHDLFDVVMSLKSHDCNNILTELIELWNIIKDDVKEEKPYTLDPNKFDDAINLLSQCSSLLSWSNIFSLRIDDKDYEQRLLTRNISKYKQYASLFPAIKTIYNEIVNQQHKPFHVYALTEEVDGKTELLTLRSGGYCVFDNEDRAKEMCDEFNKMYESNIEVKFVRISVENGVEFL